MSNTRIEMNEEITNVEVVENPSSLGDYKTINYARQFYKDLFDIPKDKFYLVTHPDYSHGFDQKENDHAYLRILKPETKCELRGNMLMVDGDVLATVKYMDHITGEIVTSIDIPMVNALYSVVAMKLETEMDNVCPPGFDASDGSFRNTLPDDIRYADDRTLFEWYHRDLFNYTVAVHMLDFMRYIGYENPSNDQIESVKKRIWALTRVVGVMRTDGGVRPGDGDYLMMDPGFDVGSNVFFIHSPYINKFTERLLRNRIPRLYLDNGKRRDSKDEVVYLPATTNMVRSDISSAKNKRAVEVVFEIARFLARAGKHTPKPPSISYMELIGRCSELSLTLMESKNADIRNVRYRNQVLRRTFKNVWEYLRKYTSIAENYSYVEYIPKDTDYNYVFVFHHKDKKSSETGEDVPKKITQ